MANVHTDVAGPDAIDTVRRTIFAIALFLGGTFSAQAGFEDGKVAYARGDYGTAFREWLPAAAAGDARAQHVVGLMYSIGEGVRRDDVQAHMWIDLAVATIHPRRTSNGQPGSASASPHGFLRNTSNGLGTWPRRGGPTTLVRKARI